MNQGPPNWTDAGGDPKSWDAVSHYPPWPPLANRPALAFAKPLSWCHLSWGVGCGGAKNYLVEQHFEL